MIRHNRLAGLSALVVFGLWSPALSAQVTTERFIPVGQSPGLSGVTTFIGQIRGIDAEAGTCTVSSGSDSRTIQLTEATRIWLDRSQLRQTTATGSAEDLLPGRTVEVRYLDDDPAERADWIKVAVEEGLGARLPRSPAHPESPSRSSLRLLERQRVGFDPEVRHQLARLGARDDRLVVVRLFDHQLHVR